MEESPGIKLFGATITLQDRRQHQQQSSRSRSSDDKKDPTESAENMMKRPDKIIPCPRCKSMETKFCYFNNYNVSQPRHFCKGCQRYWTAGGALRNVPVGAGRRKNKPVPCTAARDFSSDDIIANCGLYYEANPPDDVVQHYFDLQGSVVVENSWHLMAAAAAAESDFRQVTPSVKRRRNGEVDS